jgi:hypothetical protein
MNLHQQLLTGLPMAQLLRARAVTAAWHRKQARPAQASV